METTKTKYAEFVKKFVEMEDRLQGYLTEIERKQNEVAILRRDLLKFDAAMFGFSDTIKERFVFIPGMGAYRASLDPEGKLAINAIKLETV